MTIHQSQSPLFIIHTRAPLAGKYRSPGHHGEEGLDFDRGQEPDDLVRTPLRLALPSTNTTRQSVKMWPGTSAK